MKYWLAVLLAVVFGCSTTKPWKFSRPPSTLVITQRLVVQKNRPILYVIHDDEGEWRFLSDERVQLVPVVEVTIRDLVAIDSSIVDLAYLKKGWKAWRTDKASPWNSAMYK
jgi:hypothetical protein